VVEKALAKNPADRFPSAGGMLVALRQARSTAATDRAEAPLDRAPAPTAPRPPARGAGGERAAHSSRSSVPPTSPDGSRRLLLAALALGLLAVVGGAWALRSYVLGRPVSPPAPAPETGSLARKAIDSQVELARRRLEAGSFRDAMREAEQALKLDPQSAGAREVLLEAGAAVKAIDDALAAVRSATTAADRGRLAGAAFDLMKLDPGHPEAERAATAAAAAFRPLADEARRLAQEARREAAEAGADRTAAFAEAALLDQKGERALQSGDPAAAARHFLEARLGFERARRARP
jgi:hypothetical protein